MFIRMLIKNTLRHKLRTILTIMGIAVAITAFCFLRTVIYAWYLGAKTTSANRIVTRNSISLIFPLPLSYKEKIAQVPHITKVTYGNWFQGIYKDEKNFFAQFAVDADAYFDLYPEFIVPQDQLKTFKMERNAAIAGRKLAERFKWKVGDTIRIQGVIYPGNWDFVIRGIYTGAQKETDETQFFFNWNYLEQSLQGTSKGRASQVGFYMMRIDEPDRAPEICKAVDDLFKNSAAETKTETENQFVLGFISMSDAIMTCVQIISIVVIIIILMVLANTMAMSIRERIGEYAVIKTLGFSTGYIIFLIAGESMIITITGWGLGLGLTVPVIGIFTKAISGLLTGFEIVPNTVLISGVSALVVGVLSALFPAVIAVRMKIVDGLRQIG